MLKLWQPEFDPMNVSSTQKESHLSFLIQPYSMFIQIFNFQF